MLLRIAQALGLGFVVPAGGLGERLGFSDIKLMMPCEIATGMPVLMFYCHHIVALQVLLLPIEVSSGGPDVLILRSRW